jgi:hypothetical protein
MQSLQERGLFNAAISHQPPSVYCWLCKGERCRIGFDLIADGLFDQQLKVDNDVLAESADQH